MSAALLLYFILTHQFQYSYVELQFNRFAVALADFYFLCRTRRKFPSLGALHCNYWHSAFVLFAATRMGNRSNGGVQSCVRFLLGMLVVKNPYTFVWETFPKDLIHTGTIPQTTENFVWLDPRKEFGRNFRQKERD